MKSTLSKLLPLVDAILTRLKPVRHRLLQWASAGTWLAVTVIFCVSVWGWIDPFGLRQRLDWMVSDQFYRRRTPPAVHPDLLQVSLDDRAAEELGNPIPRHVYARVLRQLQSLGARTVMIDVLFADPNDRVALEHADRLLVPRAAVVADPELSRAFSEDMVLAEAMAEVDRLVISYYLPVAYATSAPDERTRDAMAKLLGENLSRTAAELAEPARVDEKTARRLFEPALRLALARLARSALQSNAAVTNAEAAAQFQSAQPAAAGYAARFVKALDRERADAALRQKGVYRGATALPRLSRLESNETPQTPVFPLAAAADFLGFFDSTEDADGRIRRLPLVKRWGAEFQFHELLLAGLSHAGVDPAGIQFDSSGLRSPDARVQVRLDNRGQMAINWPMSDRRHWPASVPQISLADLVDLDRYERDLAFGRDERRRYLASLEKLAPTGEFWDKHFDSIQAAYAIGDVAKAAERERRFDQGGEPTILDQPEVRQALDRARQAGSLAAIPADDRLAQFARGVLDAQERIQSIDAEYRSVRSDLEQRVRGKLCLIGDTTTGSADLKQTPIGSDVPGISVIAAAINTMLSGKYPREFGYPFSALFMLVVAAGLAVPFLKLGPVRAGACGVAGVLATIFGSFGLFAAFDAMISPITPVAGLLTLYLTTTTYQWLNEYRQRMLVRTIFEAQTNPTIVERLIEAGRAGVEEVLTPKNRQVTLFFAEIADFEELAQQVAPERLPEFLSRTFGTMEKVIKANEGTVDRNQGHALVAFFGAPIYQPDHAQRACRTALECCDTIRSQKTAWQERGLPVPRIQIGLHTGELLVGNLTFTSRVDYTVAGDNLNVAYRIGELNETYDTEVILSQATLERCENLAEAREIDLVRIKGRREPIRAYELMSAKGRLTPEQLQLRGAFSTGLIAFRNKDYTAALALFRTCRDTTPGDRPATVYIERCERELKQTMLASISSADVNTVLPTEPVTPTQAS